MAVLDEPRECSAAENLEIVRVSADGEDTHQRATLVARRTRTEFGCRRSVGVTMVPFDDRNVSQRLARVETIGAREFDRSRFDHIGLVTDEEKDGESFVPATRVWVTNPRANGFNVEWLRFEPDSPVSGPLRTAPHVAYRVDDLGAAIEGHVVLAEPFDPTGRGDDFLRVAFVEVGGAVIELMQYGNPDETGWF